MSIQGVKAYQPRATGPRVEYAHEDTRYPFQVRGLRGQSPRFPTRESADEWLRIELAKVAEAMRPKVRSCMRCRDDFESEGFHNRMCTTCRNAAGGPDTSVYRVIRPSSRG
jgi:hypothetical protein